MKVTRRYRPVSFLLLGLVASLAGVVVVSWFSIVFSVIHTNDAFVGIGHEPVHPAAAVTTSGCDGDASAMTSRTNDQHQPIGDDGANDDGIDYGGECDLYLAPSSIADNENRPAGFGVFTTKPLKSGEYIKPQGEGPSIIIPDLKVNNRHSGVNSQVWQQLIFIAPAAGFITETHDPRLRVMNSLQLFVDLGALSNFHPYLKNVLYDDATVYRDDLLNRYKDPGAGAFSYHQGNRWFVTRDVEAGEELFNDYDETWFFDEQMGKTGKALPHRRDYRQAAALLWDLIMKQNPNNPDLTEEFMTSYRKMLQSDSKHDARAVRLFPRNETELLELMHRYNVKKRDDAAMALARRSVFNYSVDWIKKHGQCLVNIIPKPSTIPQAGMGAFAARIIKKGDVVSPAPAMLQIPRKKSLDIYRYEFDDNSYSATGEQPVSQQLLLNYCFGHEKSTMVLCPASSANLINHCGPQVSKGEGHCDERGPNAEVRWATKFDPETSVWLEKSIPEIEHLVSKGRRGLSFEIVALRDVKPGEEIFINYGPEWEKAWENHVTHWTPPPGDSSTHVSITEMNNDKERWIRTPEELILNPYPFTVQVACFVRGFHHPCEVLKRTRETEADVFDEGPKRRHLVYSVVVHELDRGNNNHEVRYRWRFPGESVQMTLSARYIRFFPGLHSSDQHLQGAFRHYIGVRDDLWPKQWMNMS